MPDLWFFVGLAMGISLAGFAAVGSFARGAESARRRAWRAELAAPAIAGDVGDRRITLARP